MAACTNGKNMIKAVIWDFGGVFTSSPFEAFARYETEKGIPVGTIRKTLVETGLDKNTILIADGALA